MADLTFVGRRSEARITRYQPELVVSVDDRAYAVRPLPSDAPDRFHFALEEDVVAGLCCEDDSTIYLHMDGRHFSITKHSFLSAGLSSVSEGAVCAELPGNVVSVHCAIGDMIAAGDLLLMTASMKMEVPVLADRGGEIEAILVAPGQSFERGAPLVRIREALPAL